MFSQPCEKIGTGIVLKSVSNGALKNKYKCNINHLGGPGKEGDLRLKAIYFTFVVTWSEMG